MVQGKSQHVLKPEGTWQCLIQLLPLGVLRFRSRRRPPSDKKRKRQGKKRKRQGPVNA